MSTPISRSTPVTPAASTPGAHWRIQGGPDPHAGQYDKERASLTLGHLTDDELANAAFLKYDSRPSVQDLADGKAHSPMIYMMAVKERIRWLSRALAKALTPQVAPASTQKPIFEIDEDGNGDLAIFRPGFNVVAARFSKGGDSGVELGTLLYTSPTLPADSAVFARAIHYPECWDTAAYPNLDSALHELAAWFRCSDDTYKTKQREA